MAEWQPAPNGAVRPDRSEETGTGEPGAPAPAVRPNFCARCGAPWDPSWTHCPLCAAGTATPPPLPPTAFGRPRERPIRSALSLYFTLLGFSVLGMILAVAGALSEVSADVFVSVAFCAVVLVWVLRGFRRIRPGLLCAGKLWWYPAGAGLACLTFAAAALAVRLLVSLGGQELNYSQSFLDAGYGWAGVILFVCVQPAVAEELAFRGVILSALRGILGLRDAVIVSALMFMVLHLAVLSFPHLLVIGLVLGYVRVRSGSLYPCMVLHFTHNLLVVLAEMKGL